MMHSKCQCLRHHGDHAPVCVHSLTQVFFAFTIKACEVDIFGNPVKQNQTTKDLAYIHYFDSPESNAWRKENGEKPMSRASLKIERDAIGFKCPTVEPCYSYSKSGMKLPWVQVVPLEDVTRLVSFAPHFIRHSEVAEQWFVYDLLPVSSAHEAAEYCEIMAEHFRPQLED